MTGADVPARVAGVLLAAGASRRFGRDEASKLLAPVGGVPVVRRAAEALLAGGARPLFAVVGHRAESVEEALRGAAVRVVRHPEYAAGQGTSLARGIRALEEAEALGAAGVRPSRGGSADGEELTAGVAVALGDEPGLRAEAVEAVLAAWRRVRPPAARAVYRDRPGHPVVFGRPLFPRLRALTGDRGAADLLAGLGDDLLRVPVDGPAPVDVDTGADLERLRGARAPEGAG